MKAVCLMTLIKLKEIVDLEGKIVCDHFYTFKLIIVIGHVFIIYVGLEIRLNYCRSN